MGIFNKFPSKVLTYSSKVKCTRTVRILLCNISGFVSHGKNTHSPLSVNSHQVALLPCTVTGILP